MPLWKMALVLSLNGFNGLIFTSMSLLALPAQVKALQPEHYAVMNGLAVCLGAWALVARMAAYFAVQGALCFAEARGWVGALSPWLAVLLPSPLFTAAMVDLL